MGEKNFILDLGGKSFNEYELSVIIIVVNSKQRYWNQDTRKEFKWQIGSKKESY